MNNRITNMVILLLIVSIMVINNMESLYTIKTVSNSVAMTLLVLIGCERLYQNRKHRKKAL